MNRIEKLMKEIEYYTMANADYNDNDIIAEIVDIDNYVEELETFLKERNLEFEYIDEDETVVENNEKRIEPAVVYYIAVKVPK